MALLLPRNGDDRPSEISRMFQMNKRKLIIFAVPYLFICFVLYILIWYNSNSIKSQNFQSFISNFIDIDKLEDIYIWLYYGIIKLTYDRYISDRFNTQTYKIPKICYQTWITKDKSKLSSFTLSLLEQNKNLNPDIEFQLWDDNDIDKFIKNEFTENVYLAYKSLNPIVGAAKADFFRYCVIYKYGGLYLDLKSTFKIPHIFGNIIYPNEEGVLDIRRSDKQSFREAWHYVSYEQWFLAFSPRHPY